MRFLRFVVLLIFVSVFISCKRTEVKEDIFKNVPLENTNNFVDSIRHNIRLDAGENFTARPTLEKGQYYYDERNFRDSLGNLREYSIIQRWDTGDICTNYYYYRNQLVDVSKIIFTLHIYQISNYLFRRDSLFDYIETQLTSMPTDTILNRSYRYLSIKSDVGDPKFRKYFGKTIHPPNSMIDLVK